MTSGHAGSPKGCCGDCQTCCGGCGYGAEPSATTAAYLGSEPLRERVGVVAEGLRSEYELYVKTITSRAHAISPEVAALLTALCEHLRPRRLLDLGTGFSTVAFKRYAAKIKPQPDLWSVDESALWLERTRRFLAGRGYGDGCLVQWRWFSRRAGHAFDLISLDLGSCRSRVRHLPTVLEWRAQGGIVVLTDIQIRKYRKAVVRIASDHGGELIDLPKLTKDDLGRYAGVIVRREAR